MQSKNYLPGILRDKTMDVRLMYIHNDGRENYPFCRTRWLKSLETNSLELTNNKSNEKSKSNE